MNMQAVSDFMTTAPVVDLEAIAKRANYELTQRNSGRSTTDAVIAEVAGRYGMTAAQMKGARGSQAVSVVRYAAYDAVRLARPHLSFPMIGRAFGGRDHSTIIEGIEKHRARMIWAQFLIWAGKGGAA